MVRTPREGGAEEVDSEVARLLRGVGVGTYTSIRAFAERCGVSHETVARLLRAPKPDERRRPIIKATSDALADGAGLSREVMERAVMADSGYSREVTNVDGVQAVLAQLRGMSDADRRTVLSELAQEVAAQPPRPDR